MKADGRCMNGTKRRVQRGDRWRGALPALLDLDDTGDTREVRKSADFFLFRFLHFDRVKEPLEGVADRWNVGQRNRILAHCRKHGASQLTNSGNECFNL